MEDWQEEQTIFVEGDRVETHNINPEGFLSSSHGYWKEEAADASTTAEISYSTLMSLLKYITPSPIFRFINILAFGCYVDDETNEQIIVDPHTLTSIRYITTMLVSGTIFILLTCFILYKNCNTKVTYSSQIKQGFQRMTNYKRNREKIKKTE